MYDRLLVPVRSTDGSRAALAYAVAVARDTDATIDVVHVLETGRLAELLGTVDEDAARERAADLLADLTAAVADTALEIETHVVEGRPGEAIRSFADERDSDFTVMGRHGPHGIRERTLGSVTDRVVRTAVEPVLTVRGETIPAAADVEIESVLVPTDGSDAAESVAADAAELATRFGADIHVVSVLDLQSVGGPFDAGGLSSEFVTAAETRHREAAERLATELRETTEASVTEAVLRGTPHVALDEYATDHGIGLVVMGRRGHSAVGEGLLGSVTSRVLRTVAPPVVVVPNVQ